jgi:hypothetical protein
LIKTIILPIVKLPIAVQKSHADNTIPIDISFPLNALKNSRRKIIWKPVAENPSKPKIILFFIFSERNIWFKDK